MKSQIRFQFFHCMVMSAILVISSAACRPAATPLVSRPTETVPPTVAVAATVARRPTETLPPKVASATITLRPTETVPPTRAPTQTRRPTETVPPTKAAVTPRPTEIVPPVAPPYPPTAPMLLAHYRLRDNANDSTGKFGPMTLENAPFKDDGVYCNGIYKYSGKDKPCLMDTPNLSSLDFRSLSIGAKFKTGNYHKMPVFVGGRSNRWIAFYLNSDGSVSLMYNNSNYQSCTGKYRLNTWHEAIVTYNGSTGRLYLDGKLGCSANFKISDQYSDKDISTTNFSSAEVFEGVLSDLRIYKGVLVP